MARVEARVDALIVGAGVVGLATAAELGRRLHRVLLVERNQTFGLEVSSRNSEVIHGGLYYPPGSLKARLCLEGAALIYERARERSIPVIRRGKLVVATEPGQRGRLEALHHNATAAGARDLELIDGAEVARREPALTGRTTGAIVSPWTGVVDSHELLRSYAVEAVNRRVDAAYGHTLRGLARLSSGRWRAELEDPSGERVICDAETVINAAGLGSDQVAAMAGIDVDEAGYRLYPCKGDYFSVRRAALRGISHLVYPLPHPRGLSLGVHLTIDAAGEGRFGPDATYIPREELGRYDVDEGKHAPFLAAGRELLPWLEGEDIAPERSGVRPKRAAPGQEAVDFVIRDEGDRGLAGLINLIGIESPGLTSAPAIARLVAAMIE